MSEEKRTKVRESEFVSAFLKHFYKVRYKAHLEEIQLLSKDKFDPSKAVLPP